MNDVDRQQEGDATLQEGQSSETSPGNVSRETTEQEQESSEQEQESSEQQSSEQQSFSREYVERLRDKSAGYRLRAKESEQRLEEVQRALFRERVQRLDMLVNPEELPYNPALLDSPEELTAAVETLLESKPYLRKRKAGGDIGQHDQQSNGDGFSLLGALRANAG